MTMNREPGLADVMRACGFDDPANAAAAVQTVKKRALALIREVVAETLKDASELESEMAELRASLTLLA